MVYTGLFLVDLLVSIPVVQSILAADSYPVC